MNIAVRPSPADIHPSAAPLPLSALLARWRDLTTSGLPVVRDAGFTEIAPGKTVAVEGGRHLCPLPR